MSEEPEGTESEVGVGGALSTVGDTLGDLVTGIPTPIRKNAVKAFARLCTAAVEYPVALIEGAIAEKCAESRARVKLIDTSASQIAEQMQTNPEYAHAATVKFANKIIRERVNVDQVSKIAAVDLKSEPLPSVNDQQQEAPPISEDWLNAFESEAAQMSSEQMQRIPHANIIIDARVVSMGSAGSNSLQAYGLGFDALNVLQEYGLVISDYNSYMDYRTAVVRDGRIILPVIYQNALWGFVPKVASPVLQEFKVNGVGFSKSGVELLSIVDIEPNEQYTAALKNFFDQQGMMMTSVA